MKQEEIEKLVKVRMLLFESFKNTKDWKSNRNAIMRELDHVDVLREAIKQIDVLLSGHVTFS